MIPLTVKPKVVVLLNRKNEVMAVATNVAPVNPADNDPLNVVTCHTMADFNSHGLPFNSTNPTQPVQVLAHGKH